MTGSSVTWINGRVHPIGEGRIPALDRGLLYGDGVFETMRSYAGHVFRMGEHLRRLADSAGFLGITPRYSSDDLARIINELLDGSDQYLRLTLTRGRHAGSLSLQTDEQPTVIIHTKPLHEYPPEFRLGGMPVCITKVRRNEASPIVRHKTLNYLENLLARQEASERGCGEGLMLNTSDEVAEGATSNIFCVRGDTVETPSPDAGLLPGITRAVVIALCRELDIPVRETRPSPEELCAADEVFLTNSIMELMPVRSIDGQASELRVPGPVTQNLLDAYHRAVNRERQCSPGRS